MRTKEQDKAKCNLCAYFTIINILQHGVQSNVAIHKLHEVANVERFLHLLGWLEVITTSKYFNALYFRKRLPK